MAEGFLRKYGGEQFEAYSAGLESEDVNPYSNRVMEEMGVSLSGQYSKHVILS
jgi:arsenate reductase (thioredoxin)